MGEEGYARLISCPVNPLEEDHKPAHSLLNSWAGGTVKKKKKKLAIYMKSCFSVNALFLHFSV